MVAAGAAGVLPGLVTLHHNGHHKRLLRALKNEVAFTLCSSWLHIIRGKASHSPPEARAAFFDVPRSGGMSTSESSMSHMLSLPALRGLATGEAGWAGAGSRPEGATGWPPAADRRAGPGAAAGRAAGRSGHAYTAYIAVLTR